MASPVSEAFSPMSLAEVCAAAGDGEVTSRAKAAAIASITMLDMSTLLAGRSTSRDGDAAMRTPSALTDSPSAREPRRTRHDSASAPSERLLDAPEEASRRAELLGEDADAGAV